MDFDANNNFDVNVNCETVLKNIDSIPVKNTVYIKTIVPFICEPLIVIINLCFLLMLGNLLQLFQFQNVTGLL